MEEVPSQQTLHWMIETEEIAEDILADRQQLVQLDRQRQETRQAVRVLNKDKESGKAWMCFGNMFLKLPKAQTQRLLNKDFDNLDMQISDIRTQLKTKVNKLRDLENKEGLRGFNLSALSAQERQALDDVL